MQVTHLVVTVLSAGRDGHRRHCVERPAGMDIVAPISMATFHNDDDTARQSLSVLSHLSIYKTSQMMHQNPETATARYNSWVAIN